MRKVLMIGALLSLFACGGRSDADFKALLEKARNDLKAKSASHQAIWGLGTAARWDLNQDDGVLIFTFPDKKVMCDAQIIGSYDKSRGTWLWAWDNRSAAPKLTTASKQLLGYGKQHGIEKLTRAEWKATEQDAWDMAALATLICQDSRRVSRASGRCLRFYDFRSSEDNENGRRTRRRGPMTSWRPIKPEVFGAPQL